MNLSSSINLLDAGLEIYLFFVKDEIIMPFHSLKVPTYGWSVRLDRSSDVYVAQGSSEEGQECHCHSQLQGPLRP